METEESSLIWYPGHELLLTDIVRAENCHVFDSDGKRYVDLESGVWCTSIGHGNASVRAVMAAQAARIGHAGFSYVSPVVEEAAQEILSLLDFEGGKCVFLCSGSEAVEYGVRVARAIVDRPLFITMADSYFGAYGSAATRDLDTWFCFDWTACAACHEGCEHWAAIPFERIGGFLFEPGSSSGLVHFPPEQLVRRIADRVREEGGLVLVNEVTTGLGRTGTWFGYQHYGISPDIVALGKGIGNGYPVSVAAFARGAVRRLGGRPVKYAQSHQNDPLGAALAKTVVRTIREEGLIDRGRDIAALLAAGLEGISLRYGRIKEIRGRGLMTAIEFYDDAVDSFTSSIHRELVHRGFLVGRRPGAGVLRLDPSLTIAPEDIEDFLQAFDDIMCGRL